eukprot:CAMPEP_0173223440 /NCGR_PEP_ID=MMETSP1142-20121109/3785_1 /TAXON_ID=483371 /ORGANISM="non described non described, Strain CCMP2298" /LENGTH=108 /DNA_ID=CAMNT_0014151597 /DNA_START=623 /DNA_END=945 /DNA_ORIENTATION=+
MQLPVLLALHIVLPHPLELDLSHRQLLLSYMLSPHLHPPRDRQQPLAALADVPEGVPLGAADAVGGGVAVGGTGQDRVLVVVIKVIQQEVGGAVGQGQGERGGYAIPP